MDAAEFGLHMETHVASMETHFPANCNRCKAGFKTIEQMKLHTTGNHQLQEKDVICDLCYNIVNKRQLQTHKAKIHKIFDENPCQHCDYQATQSSSLQTHMKSMHEGIKYPCHQCDYQATQSSHLQRHIESRHIKYL